MLNFCVGPVQTDEAVRTIGSHQVPYFRTSDFSGVMQENERMMLDLMHAPSGSRCLFLTCSGTGSMEAAVMNLLSEDDKALVVRGGSFGSRFSRICDYHRIPHDDITLQPGHPLTQADLAPFDRDGYTAFLVNMDETSTGVLYDLPLISSFCRRHGLFLLVDAVSSFLADPLEMAEWGVGAVVTCSQKALALPPGLAFAVLAPEAQKRVERISCPSLYFDFKAYLLDGERGQTPYTPAVQTLLQLHARLEEIEREGGQEAEVRRCAALARYFRERAFGGAYPFSPFSLAPANGVTSILAHGFDAHALFEVLRKEYGIWICPNGGDLASTVFRVGHLGDLHERDYDTLCAAFDAVRERGLLG